MSGIISVHPLGAEEREWRQGTQRFTRLLLPATSVRQESAEEYTEEVGRCSQRQARLTHIKKSVHNSLHLILILRGLPAGVHGTLRVRGLLSEHIGAENNRQSHILSTIVLHDSSISDDGVVQGDDNPETPKSDAKSGTDSGLPRHQTIGDEFLPTRIVSIVGEA